MKIDVLTLFPDVINEVLHESIVGKALEKQLFDLNVINFRDYSDDKHHHVDDTPYGGGAGMLLQPQPIFRALDDVNTQSTAAQKRVILLDPAGVPFTQKIAENLAHEEELVFICGHYEGYDERIRTLVTDEFSLGDFVLTGGELGALTMIDATVRLLPGVLGNQASNKDESFSTGLLEYPQYTRPPEYRGLKVPDVLMSGNHQEIDKWRAKEALRRTYERRPDLLSTYDLSSQQKKWLREFERADLGK
ncbi:trmD protein [Lactobacillus selangorensis]|uniref:tRNA (guanine-N(1)-)-methyltransferase n=1 Tax=Lactobacillus selangorensis TaxID=81857 RepID=A0A0R2FM58_9LACO|nr:tRNA (guanosine(37)-N1)-methyltransferase TrmD [Lactobacillus selangorensis]KRN29624.1 trmD protein [Lactobacillus selangorensis]KRN33846.1 trmD protein [Lactobacillus selangorensis]